MKNRQALFLLTLAAIIGATGCAYPISAKYRDKVRKRVTFTDIREEPEEYKGETVIWGGVILETKNTDEGSELEVLQTPLNFLYEPGQAKKSRGRFIAKTSKFMDPEIYDKSKVITVAGTVVGKRTRKLDEANYTYPVVQIEESYLWERTRDDRYYYYPRMHFGYYYGDPWYYY